MTSFADTVANEAEAMAQAAAGDTGGGSDADAPTGNVGDTSAEPVDVDGPQAVATGETGGVTPDTETQPTEAQRVPLRALEDEREKRQYERKLRESTEQRVAELEQRIAAMNAKTEAKPEPVDYDRIFEDPKGVLDAHTRAIMQSQSTSRMEVSREQARASLHDYDDTVAKLATLSVPGLEDAVAKSPSPAFTAYRMIKDHEKAMKAQTSPELEAVRAELEEAKKAIAAMRGEQQRPAPSLSQSRAASGGSRQPSQTVEDVLQATWGKPY